MRRRTPPQLPHSAVRTPSATLLAAASAAALFVFAPPAAAADPVPAPAQTTTAAPPAAVEAAPCARPPSERAPDPRCDEPLDSRREAPESGWLAVPRAVLWVPRAASRIVFWPVVRAGDFIESRRIPAWIEALLTTDDRLVGVRPEVHYSTSFLPTGGLRLFYRRLPGHGSELRGRFLTAGPSVLLGDVELEGPSWLGLTLAGVFNRRDDRLFGGIGPSSKADLAAAGRNLARYGSDAWMTELRWSGAAAPRLLAHAHGDVQRRDYQASQVRGGDSVAVVYGAAPATCAAAGLAAPCVDETILPGFERGLRMAHAGGGLTLDARSHARDGSGVSAVVDATFGRGLGQDPTRDALFTGEVVGALGGIDRALLLRGRASMVEALGAAPVPFEELVSPAGSTGMRGFAEGRFRDASGVVATAEYRYFIAANMDASLFTDVGTVAGPRFAGIRSGRWFPSVGAGLRFYDPAGPHWEAAAKTGLQLAYAPDAGFRVLLALAGF